MRRIIGLSTLSGSVLALPMLAFAQVGIMRSIIQINQILNGLIGIIITIAIIVFFWGLVRYLTDVGEAKHNGLIMMFYGLIALFVMVSVWGIIHLLQSTFGVSNSAAIVPDLIPAGSTFR